MPTLLSCPYSRGAICAFRQSREYRIFRNVPLGNLHFSRQCEECAPLRGISAVVKVQACIPFDASDGGPSRQVPKHIGVIMDGNGRWAAERGHIASMGHKAGIDALQIVVESCLELGIKYLSVFALSTENSISRNEQEVKYLIQLVHSVVHERLNSLHTEGVRLKFIGDYSSLDNNSLSNIIQRAESLTGNNDTLVLTIALNFSGRQDIVAATQTIAKQVQDGYLDIHDINISLISHNLSLSHIAKEHQSPDLLIRTGGEQRLSNFILWHLAYTELYFADVYWPDFGKEHLKAAIDEFSNRNRRFGARTF